MAAGLANRGLMDEDLFFENSMEGWIVWDKVEALVSPQGAASKNPTYWAQLEQFAQRFEAWRDHVAPGSLEAFRQARANARRAAKSAN